MMTFRLARVASARTVGTMQPRHANPSNQNRIVTPPRVSDTSTTASRPTSHRANCLRFLRANALLVCSCVFLTISLFFFVQVERYRAELTRTDATAFQTGDIVTITGVIDGDEVLVQNTSGDKAHVRLLGIRSFSPIVNDPVLAQIGKACFSFLKSNYVGQEARITVNEDLKVDKEGRLLAYLAVRGTDSTEHNVDIGLELIQRGLTLTYIRYPFSREVEYLQADQKSKAEKTGLWDDANIVDRAQALQADWQQSRQADEAKDDAS